MRTSCILFCALLFMVVGCAEVPIPASFPYSGSDEILQKEPSYFRQQQLQSVTHWQLMAKLTVERLSSDPDLVELLKPDSEHRRALIYVQEDDKSPFGQAFLKLLITELNKKSMFKLCEPPDASIYLRWTTQLVDRNPVRPKTFLGVPAFIAQLAGFILMGNGWNTTDLSVPHTEVLLTTYLTIGKDSQCQIIKGNSWSDIFYINDGDSYNYQVATAPTAPLAYSVHPRSIAAKNEAWRARLAKEGLLSR